MLADLLKNTDQNKPQYSTESLMVALEHFNHVQVTPRPGSVPYPAFNLGDPHVTEIGAPQPTPHQPLH
jgi:hypothetical protein